MEQDREHVNYQLIVDGQSVVQPVLDLDVCLCEFLRPQVLPGHERGEGILVVDDDEACVPRQPSEGDGVAANNFDDA